jgi:hypothetical protein
VPQLGAGGGVGAERRGCAERQTVHQVDAHLLKLGQLLRAVGVVLDQECGVVPDREVEDYRGSARECLAHLQGQCVHQLQSGRPGFHECGQGGVRSLQIREDQQPGGHVGKPRDRPEDRLGHEAERPFAAHDQVGQNVHRPVEVQQGVDAVPHGVLHGELVLDGCHRGRVGAHSAGQPQQALVQLGFQAAQALIGAWRTCVDHGAAGQHDGQGLQRLVRVVHGAAGHAG